METEISEKEAIQKIYEYAAHLLFVKQKSQFEVKKILVKQGLDNTSATILVNKLNDQKKSIKKSTATKNIIWGAIWCFGGLFATMADIGLIFWGAILFGGLQLVGGLFELSKE